MSMSMDMDNDDYEMITLHGSWARERQIDVRGIGYGKQSELQTAEKFPSGTSFYGSKAEDCNK